VTVEALRETSVACVLAAGNMNCFVMSDILIVVVALSIFLARRNCPMSYTRLRVTIFDTVTVAAAISL
jgi:hypothetical protein